MLSVVISGTLGVLLLRDYDLLNSLAIVFLSLSLFIFPFQLKFLDIRNLLQFIAFFIFLTQLIIAFKLDPFSELLQTVYARSDLTFKSYQEEMGMSQLSWVRFGGLYLNPNLCAKAYTFIFGLYLALNVYEKKSIIPISAIVFLGLLLTGSRTGMGIFVMMLFANQLTKNAFKLIFACVFLFLLAIVFESRFFDIESIIKSPAEKYAFVLAYISNIFSTNPLIGLFGSGDFGRTIYDFNLRLTHFDSELGYFIQGFGLLGIFYLLALLVLSFRAIPSGSRTFLINLFWIFSSGLFVNFRFGFVFLICLSFIIIYHIKYSKDNINAKN